MGQRADKNAARAETHAFRVERIGQREQRRKDNGGSAYLRKAAADAQQYLAAHAEPLDPDVEEAFRHAFARAWHMTGGIIGGAVYQRDLAVALAAYRNGESADDLRIIHGMEVIARTEPLRVDPDGRAKPKRRRKRKRNIAALDPRLMLLPTHDDSPPRPRGRPRKDAQAAADLTYGLQMEKAYDER